MTQISKNFKLYEFLRSDTALQKGIKNEPGGRERLALINLVTKLLQPLRDMYGKPMSINSGYRSIELNRAVGGAVNSQHTKGEAADVRCNPSELVACLKKSGLDYDQCIQYPTFVHLSLKLEGMNRKQYFKK